MRALAWGRLLRLSLAPSAAADIAAGLTLGGIVSSSDARDVWIGPVPEFLHWTDPQPWLLIASSLAIYHGGMVLNDWADRSADQHTRPDRPIPSGQVSAGTALGTGLGLELLGVLLAFGAGLAIGVHMAVVALLVVLYDLWGRGAMLGPLLLGLCRALNLGAGIHLASAPYYDGLSPWPIPPSYAFAVLYFAYVFFASRLGRLEDGEESGPIGRRPVHYLWTCAVVLMLVPGLSLGINVLLAPATAIVAALPVPNPIMQWSVMTLVLNYGRVGIALIVAGFSALGLVRLALARREWGPPDVGRAMGACLRRLLVFTACCSLGDFLVAGAILAGYPLSFALRRVFPPS